MATGTMESLWSKANQTQLAPVENGTTASRAYAVGAYFCKDGLLYRVTAAISNGGTITPGTNCVATTVGASLADAMPYGMHLVDYVGTYPTTVAAQTINTGIPSSAYAVCLGAASVHKVNFAHYSLSDISFIMNGSNLRFTPSSDSVNNYGGQPFHAFILYFV